MKLTMHPRTDSSKASLRQLRADGKIPAVIYSKGHEAISVSVEGDEYDAILRSIEKGTLSTARINLTDAQGKVVPVLVKEIQYHPTTYAVLHLDFERLVEGSEVNVNVPVQCTGVMDCVGIKLGGVLRQVIRTMRVRCLPQHIPAKFQIDVRELQMRETKRLKDIALPANVRPLADLNEVAVVIAKR